MSSQPATWLMIAPLALLTMIAVVGLAAFVFAKLLQSQPELGAAIVKLGLLFGVGLLGLLLLAALFIGTAVSTVRHSQETATLETEWHPPVTVDVADALTPLQPEPVSFNPVHYDHTPVPVAAPVAAKLSLGMVMLLAFCGLFAFGRVVFGARNSSPRSGTGFALGGLGAVGVLFLVMILYWARASSSHTNVLEHQVQTLRQRDVAIAQQHQTAVVRTPETPLTPPPSPVQPSALTPLPTDDRTTTDDATAKTPDWVRAGVQRKGEITTLVCSSKQYSSVDEADQDARAAVRDYLLEERLRSIPKEPFGPRTTPSVEHLVQDVVRERYVETLQRDFRNFIAPMYRVWLKVEITPATYASMRTAYVASLQEARLILAGSALAALLCVPLGIMGYGQLNRATHLPRGLLKGAIGAGVLGAWTAGFVALQYFVALF